MSAETIAAIATAVGEGSIAVIRVSGSTTLEVVDKVFRGRVRVTEMESHTVAYGRIVTMEDEEAIDEVFVTVMRAPRTYTTEDVVEISTHGGLQVVQTVLVELLRAGARLAEPGEFTKRAFLGGRIDLAQAEGVMELIQAKSDTARRAALRQVEGSLTRTVRAIRQRMLELMAHIEVTIDYPEHDEEDATIGHVLSGATMLISELKELAKAASSGRVLREGIRVAIVGRPNVGKSSLLNELSRTERAIVTDVPGTTRDVIEEHLLVQGVRIVVLDTAGIRETADVVEQMGVERSRKTLEDADLLLVVVDSGRGLDATDEELLNIAQRAPSLVILSKVDLPAAVTVADLERIVAREDIVVFSKYLPKTLLDLEDAIIRKVFDGRVNPAEATFIANSRHIRLIEQALLLLEEVVSSAESGHTLDLVAVDLHRAWVLLGEVVGDTPEEDLLDQIFSQFCLGK